MTMYIYVEYKITLSDSVLVLMHKGSSIIVVIFTSVHSVRWGEGVKGDRTLF